MESIVSVLASCIANLIKPVSLGGNMKYKEISFNSYYNYTKVCRVINIKMNLAVIMSVFLSYIFVLNTLCSIGTDLFIIIGGITFPVVVFGIYIISISALVQELKNENKHYRTLGLKERFSDADIESIIPIKKKIFYYVLLAFLLASVVLKRMVIDFITLPLYDDKIKISENIYEWMVVFLISVFLINLMRYFSLKNKLEQSMIKENVSKRIKKRKLNELTKNVFLLNEYVGIVLDIEYDNKTIRLTGDEKVYVDIEDTILIIKDGLENPIFIYKNKDEAIKCNKIELYNIKYSSSD